MPPDHEFGTPQANVHKRTTKVNFAVVGAVLLFFVIGGAIFVWFMHRE